MTVANIETNLYGLDEELNQGRSNNPRKTYKDENAFLTRGPPRRQPTKDRKFTPRHSPTTAVICHYCQTPGHIAPECRKKQRDLGLTPSTQTPDAMTPDLGSHPIT